MIRNRADTRLFGRGWPIALVLGLLAAGAATRSSEILPGPVAAEVVRVIDGDTLEVRARIWPGQTVRTVVRLAGIDAPELHGKCAEERRRAGLARDTLAMLAGRNVALRDIRFGKFAGRVVARVAGPATADLAANLVARGLARPYDGGPRPGWC